MPAISTADLKSIIERNEKMILINTLPAEQFEDTKLPTAINIPEKSDDFVQGVENAAGGKEKRIVLYSADMECTSSTEAAKRLDHAGFTHVFNYRLGAKGWREDDAANAAKTTG